MYAGIVSLQVKVIPDVGNINKISIILLIAFKMQMQTLGSSSFIESLLR